MQLTFQRWQILTFLRLKGPENNIITRWRSTRSISMEHQTGDSRRHTLCLKMVYYRVKSLFRQETL